MVANSGLLFGRQKCKSGCTCRKHTAIAKCFPGCKCKKHDGKPRKPFPRIKCLSGCNCTRHTSQKCKPDCTCKRHNVPYNKGQPSPLKGVKLSRDQVARQVAARMAGKGYGVTEEQREAAREKQTGKIQTKETRTKIGDSHRGQKRKPKAVQNIRLGALKRAQRKYTVKPTSIEIKIKQELDNLEIDYKFQEILHDTYTVDFLIPGKNLIIECDGDYWHNRPGAKNRDAARDAWLFRRGYTTIRLPESAINRNAKETLALAIGNYYGC